MAEFSERIACKTDTKLRFDQVQLDLKSESKEKKNQDEVLNYLINLHANKKGGSQPHD